MPTPTFIFTPGNLVNMTAPGQAVRPVEIMEGIYQPGGQIAYGVRWWDDAICDYRDTVVIESRLSAIT